MAISWYEIMRSCLLCSFFSLRLGFYAILSLILWEYELVAGLVDLLGDKVAKFF
jgi:hypothetical protein